jgi:outer membrane lipoprotein-sorting protein
MSTRAWTESDTESLLKKMEAAYEGVNDYQAHLQVRTLKKDGSLATKEVLYTFKKPHWIRVDFKSPHRGLVLIYPNPDGKVVVRPSGLARILALRVSPDSSILAVSPGQWIDQTDLGLLIANIGHSLTNQRRSEMAVAEQDGGIRIQVLADNHFREGVITRYQFLIDRDLWLPVEVEESTPEGVLERRISFETLRVNTGVPDTVFSTIRRGKGGKARIRGSQSGR